MAPVALTPRLSDLRGDLEAYLAGLRFSSDPMTIGLERVLRYSLLAGVKRTRPLVVLCAAEVVALDRRRALPLAAAIELIHTCTLIHDDLPAMDNADLRRGRLANHRVHGEGVALLAADAMFAEAFRILLSRLEGPPDRVLAAATVVVDAVAVDGMAGGQYIDLTGAARDESAVLRLHRLKTGLLFEAGVGAVLELAQSPDDVRAPLTRYAQQLGLMYQIVNDILDVEGRARDTGKPLRQDEANRRRTMVWRRDTHSACLHADRALERAIEALEEVPGDTTELRAIAILARRRRR